MNELRGKRVAILVEDLYQEMELWYPLYRLREAGAETVLVGPKAGQTYESKHGYPARADRASADVSADEFDAVVVPLSASASMIAAQKSGRSSGWREVMRLPSRTTARSS